MMVDDGKTVIEADQVAVHHLVAVTVENPRRVKESQEDLEVETDISQRAIAGVCHQREFTV